jgi:hypothetical protein
MNIALITAVIGAIVYLICSLSGKYTEVGELGKIAFLCGLLAYLMK